MLHHLPPTPDIRADPRYSPSGAPKRDRSGSTATPHSAFHSAGKFVRSPSRIRQPDRAADAPSARLRYRRWWDAARTRSLPAGLASISMQRASLSVLPSSTSTERTRPLSLDQQRDAVRIQQIQRGERRGGHQARMKTGGTKGSFILPPRFRKPSLPPALPLSRLHPPRAAATA